MDNHVEQYQLFRQTFLDVLDWDIYGNHKPQSEHWVSAEDNWKLNADFYALHHWATSHIFLLEICVVDDQ